jgi:hypothetical protein
LGCGLGSTEARDRFGLGQTLFGLIRFLDVIGQMTIIKKKIRIKMKRKEKRLNIKENKIKVNSSY